MPSARFALAVILALSTSGLPRPDPAGANGWSSESVYFPAFPERITLGLAVDFNRGDFETDRTSDTASLTPLVRLESDNVIVRAALPLFRLDGPIEAGFSGPDETEYGVGDLTLSAAYTVYPLFDGMPFVDFVCQFKFPTAHEDFGTGAFDSTLLVSALKPLHRDVYAFVDFGIRLRGGGQYRDTLLTAFGVGAQGRTGIGIWLVYDWREAPFDDIGDEHELTPFLSIPIGNHLRLDPYVLVGLSAASPDWGVGNVISWTF